MDDVDDDLCGVCADECVAEVMMPCQHSLCAACAAALKATHAKRAAAMCPYCSAFVESFEQTPANGLDDEAEIANMMKAAEAEAAEEASRPPRALEVATRALRLATPGLEAVAALEVLREAQAGSCLSAAQLEEVVAAAKQELQIAALAPPTAAPAPAPAPPAALAGSTSPISTAESPPSPPPLTRDQIKAQYLDRLTANDRQASIDSHTRTSILVLNKAHVRDAPTARPTAGRIALGRGARGIGRGRGWSLT